MWKIISVVYFSGLLIFACIAIYKGTLLPEIGAFLERKKYRIKCLNLINFRKSMKYNPLAYICLLYTSFSRT